VAARAAQPTGGVARAAGAGTPRLLTVAGSDSGGGAGIQADLKTFAAFRTFGMSAVTAVTAQNTRGVLAWQAVPAELVGAQIDAVVGDIGVDATKVGMLGTAAAVHALGVAARRGGLGPLVVDPVMVSKSGHRLLDDEAREALAAELLPLADVLTPNLQEAAELLRCDPRDLRPLPARRDAARALLGLGPRAVVLKGGHAAGQDGERVVDVWCAAQGGGELAGPRVATRHTHGTGCTFSAALAAGLAWGWGLAAALHAAKRFVGWAIARAPGLGGGAGPLQHLLPDADWETLVREAGGA
jgi:hydroxymethylpyrimidine/phosphomethylpyrimidine kinase